MRLALIPVFLVVALRSGDGVDGTAALLYAVIAWGDYADGIAARVTKQYSRLGALMDPISDRLLVISGVAVVWRFDLLPRWALGALIFREVLMLALGRYAQQRGVVLQINWIGRWGVWPTMSAIFGALVGWHTAALVLLYVGVAMSYLALAKYLHDGLAQMHGALPPPSSSG